MPAEKEDSNTRYFIDIDLLSRKIIQISYAQRQGLPQDLPLPAQRVFITKGQFKKLQKKRDLVETKPARRRDKNV
ncbi:MAG TPA: hypothetical protein PKE49_01510 [Leptospiraceae bacterium]|nr:hypothetical protein [Leptospirales bacterium]HMU85701.1 hypothetical protein [Leptospiraceae bacterium]HMX55165.1 hypothetical protein [Leptospiraceae bacterium]HMY44054.1 hypothetical protein [Leptospiraceae bacterium]HMZ38513.1 hypothetical protein [Leptospiraceae bacterium]